MQKSSRPTNGMSGLWAEPHPHPQGPKENPRRRGAPNPQKPEAHRKQTGALSPFQASGTILASQQVAGRGQKGAPGRSRRPPQETPRRRGAPNPQKGSKPEAYWKLNMIHVKGPAESHCNFTSIPEANRKHTGSKPEACGRLPQFMFRLTRNQHA